MNKKEMNEVLDTNKILCLVKEKQEDNVEKFVYKDFITIGFSKDKAFLHHKANLFDMLYAVNLIQDVVKKTMGVMTEEQREQVMKKMDEISNQINEDGGIQTEKLEKTE